VITKDGYEFPVSFDPPSLRQFFWWGVFLVTLIGGAIAAAKHFSVEVPAAVVQDWR
jgi:hypothetical protein